MTFLKDLTKKKKIYLEGVAFKQAKNFPQHFQAHGHSDPQDNEILSNKCRKDQLICNGGSRFCRTTTGIKSGLDP